MSPQEHTFGEQILLAMRLGFGGHIDGNEPLDPEPKSKGHRVALWHKYRRVSHA